MKSLRIKTSNREVCNPKKNQLRTLGITTQTFFLTINLENKINLEFELQRLNQASNAKNGNLHPEKTNSKTH